MGQWPLLRCYHGVAGTLGELVVERGRGRVGWGCVVLVVHWWVQWGVGLASGLVGQGVGVGELVGGWGLGVVRLGWVGVGWDWGRLSQEGR